MRRMSQSRGLIATLENEELLAVAAAGESPVGDNADSLETNLLEVADSGADQEVLQEETEAAAEVAEALESISVSLESAAAAGGLDRHAANVVNTTVAALCKVAGISGGSSSMPALESYGQSSSRIGATQLAMEDIKSKAAEIWKKIVEAVKKAWAWLAERYTQIFGAANRLEKRALGLVTKAENTQGVAKDKEFENERLVKNLNIKGAVDGVAAATALAAAAGTVLVDRSGVAETVLKAIEGMDEAALATLPKTAFTGLPLTAVGKSEGFEDVGAGLVTMRSAELPGNRAIQVVTATEGDAKALAGLAASIKASVGTFDPKRAAPAKFVVGTLAIADATKVAEIVAKMAKEIQGYKSNLDKVSAVKKKIVAAMEKSSKEEVPEDKKAIAANLRKVGSVVPRMLDEPAGSFNAYAVNTGKALCDYIEESLKQYGAK
jgi:phiKZ-like phage internal head proteins